IIYDDERKAIIEFLGTVSEFYESNINIPNETNTTEGFAYMQEQIRTLEKEYSRVQIANSKLQLFCFESKILEAAKPVMTELAKIAGHTQMFRFKVLGNQRMTKLLEEQVRSSPNSMDTNYKIDIYYKEHNQTVEEFYKMKIDFYKDYIDMYSNLSLICKEYLKTKQPLSHFEKN
ncbi:MAG: hypothetical protein NTX03_06045, partial [Bacteroidetes bacterium]|nr:hypothetical protein [Bacteroidota bacterium]